MGFTLQRRDMVMRALQANGAVRVSELAEKLGVSAMTIRRDINHLVERGFAERVYGGAVLPGADRALTSRPDAHGELRRVIGMVVPNVHYYWPSIVAGAREAAAALNVHLVVRNSTYDVKDYARHTQSLGKVPGVAGLIVAPDLESALTASFLTRLEQFRVPVILADREPRSLDLGFNLEWTSSDHARGARLAVRHLHHLGHQRIGLLANPNGASARHVERGWREEIDFLGLPADTGPVLNTVDFDKPGGTQQMERALQSLIQHRVSALLLHSDPSAVAFVQYATDRGIKIPGQLSVIAYDDEVAGVSEPAICAVRPPKHAVGRLAVEKMVARIREGARRPLHNTLISPQLMIRRTTGEPVRPLSV